MAVLLPDGVNELYEILGPSGLETTLAPIVDLYTGRTMAVEALVSAANGSTLGHPDLLESAARTMGLVTELDAARWDGALQAVEAADLPHDLPIFIRVEPDSLLQLPDLRDHPFGRAVLVVSQHAMIERTAHVLRTVMHARGLGWSIAVDGVGRGRRELALLPLLEPDVIVLDPAALQGRADYARATLVQAVAAQAERTSAVVMATGVDTEARMQTALGIGATLGRGARCVGSALPRGGVYLPLLAPELRGAIRQSAPYSIAAAGRRELVSSKRLLIEMSKYLEFTADGVQPVLMLGTFQEAKHFTRLTAARWEYIARSAALAVAFSVGMDPNPAPGVRGAPLDPEDPVCQEWTALVLAPHFASVLSARDLGDGGPDMERRFSYVLSHDRDLVVTLARALLTRVPQV